MRAAAVHAEDRRTACGCVGQQAVPLHGGMGVTDEPDPRHTFKRPMMSALQFSHSAVSLKLCAGLPG